MTRYGDETGARRNELDAPVPYALTPVGEAVAAHPDTWNRDLWMALDAGDQPGPEAEREARRLADAAAWGGRGPSASYAEWLAEGQPEARDAGAGELTASAVSTWDHPNEPWWRVPANDPAHPDHKDAVAAAREADIEAADEWDDADSAGYQARVEAGLEPEAGQRGDPEITAAFFGTDPGRDQAEADWYAKWSADHPDSCPCNEPAAVGITPDRSLAEFARRVQREDESVRADEIGLRAIHAEAVEQRYPMGAVTRRAHQAQGPGAEVSQRPHLRLVREVPQLADPEPEAR